MFDDIEYLDAQIEIYKKLVKKQEEKIEKIKRIYEYTPRYEISVLNKWQRKIKSLEASKDRYTTYANH